MTAKNEDAGLESSTDASADESASIGARVLALEAQVRELQALIGTTSQAPSVPDPSQTPIGHAPPGMLAYAQHPTPGQPSFQQPPVPAGQTPPAQGFPGSPAAGHLPSRYPTGPPPQGPFQVPWTQPSHAGQPGTPDPNIKHPRGLTTEDVVSRLGIGLFILGCGYLFKYSVEHGWLGPAARVAIGALIGAVLLTAGFVLHEKRERYAAVLMGGSIAAFHVTLFGAHRLYALVDGGPAVGLVFLVNLLALGLAVRFGHLALSIIGALGAFGVPFMLDSAGDDGAFLTAYLAAIVFVNGGIALWKHWQPLLLVGFIGFWSGLGILSSDIRGISDDTVVGLAVLTWPFLGWASMYLHKERRQVAALNNIFHPPMVALVLSGVADWSDESVGAAMLCGAAVTVALALVRRARGPKVRFAVYGLAFTSCAAIATVLLAADHWIVLGLASIPLTLAAAWKLTGDDELEATAVTEAGLLSIGFGVAMLGQIDTESFSVSANSLTLLVLLATAALCGPDKRSPLLLLAHGLGMLWCFGALEPLGAGVVSAAWAAIAIVELLAGTVMNRESVRNLGVLTILAVSGKLVFFDTSNVPQVWRVLLFMGIGAAFLGVGWVLPKLTGGASDEGESA